METGYLSISTHDGHPGMVRVGLYSRPPALPSIVEATPERIRYVAYFNDADAARMHLHELLRRRLLDVESGLYRSELAPAIAAVESIGLKHSRYFLDPTLDDGCRAAIAVRASTLIRRRLRRDRWLDRLGYLALAVLLLQALAGLL